MQGKRSAMECMRIAADEQSSDQATARGQPSLCSTSCKEIKEIMNSSENVRTRLDFEKFCFEHRMNKVLYSLRQKLVKIEQNDHFRLISEIT